MGRHAAADDAGTDPIVAAALARRHFPEWPGRVPAGVLPGAWLVQPA